MQDEDLIRRIQRGEKALFTQLTEKYYDEIFRFCYYHTGNDQTAYDCTQETFLHLIRFMESYVEIKKFKAYLIRIALNVCRDHFRRSGPLPLSYEMLTEGGLNYDTKEAANTGRREDSRTVERLLVQDILMRLPDYQRDVVILHFYYGYKLKEISRITGATLPAVKSRMKQGMDKLREHCKKEGIYEE